MTYGLGLVMRDYRGLETVSHGGSWAGYRAQLLRFPEERLSIACLCNLGATDPSSLSQRVAEIYLGSDMKPDPMRPSPSLETVRLSSEELRSREGAYQEEGGDAYAFVSVRDDGLLLEGPGSRRVLHPISKTRFTAGDGVAVSIDSARLMLETGEETRSFARFEPWKPSPQELLGFAGVYESEEIGARLEIVLSSGSLAARHRTIAPDPFRPTRTDSFHAGRIDLEFRRDSQGRPSGFTLNMGRVKGLEYVRVP